MPSLFMFLVLVFYAYRTYAFSHAELESIIADFTGDAHLFYDEMKHEIIYSDNIEWGWARELLLQKEPVSLRFQTQYEYEGAMENEVKIYYGMVNEFNLFQGIGVLIKLFIKDEANQILPIKFIGKWQEDVLVQKWKKIDEQLPGEFEVV